MQILERYSEFNVRLMSSSTLRLVRLRHHVGMTYQYRYIGNRNPDNVRRSTITNRRYSRISLKNDSPFELHNYVKRLGELASDGLPAALIPLRNSCVSSVRIMVISANLAADAKNNRKLILLIWTYVEQNDVIVFIRHVELKGNLWREFSSTSEQSTFLICRQNDR